MLVESKACISHTVRNTIEVHYLVHLNLWYAKCAWGSTRCTQAPAQFRYYVYTWWRKKFSLILVYHIYIIWEYCIPFHAFTDVPCCLVQCTSDCCPDWLQNKSSWSWLYVTVEPHSYIVYKSRISLHLPPSCCGLCTPPLFFLLVPPPSYLLLLSQGTSSSYRRESKGTVPAVLSAFHSLTQSYDTCDSTTM